MTILIGALLGFLLGGFSLYGALIGMSLALLFNFLTKALKLNFNFNYFGSSGDEALVEAFPLLAARVTLAGDGIERRTVLFVKETSIRLFGRSKAVEIMKSFKSYIEKGISPDFLKERCHELEADLSFTERHSLLRLLTSVARSKGSLGQAELDELFNLADLLGIPIERYRRQERSYQQQQAHEHFHFHFNSAGDFNEFYRRFNSSFGGGQSGYGPSTSPLSISSHYETLELSQSASNDEIKQQYRALSKKYHPDRAANLPEEQQEAHEKRMREINNAYEQLKRVRNIK